MNKNEVEICEFQTRAFEEIFCCPLIPGGYSLIRAYRNSVLNRVGKSAIFVLNRVRV